jgi:hypothetical protein
MQFSDHEILRIVFLIRSYIRNFSSDLKMRVSGRSLFLQVRTEFCEPACKFFSIIHLAGLKSATLFLFFEWYFCFVYLFMFVLGFFGVFLCCVFVVVVVVAFFSCYDYFLAGSDLSMYFYTYFVWYFVS